MGETCTVCHAPLTGRQKTKCGAVRCRRECHRRSNAAWRLRNGFELRGIERFGPSRKAALEEGRPGRCLVCDEKITQTGRGATRTYTCGAKECFKEWGKLCRIDRRGKLQGEAVRTRSELDFMRLRAVGKGDAGGMGTWGGAAL